MAAFIVRSLPASVRAGVASLQQIDPSIEEASNILGADAQYTFRKVTLPLILPALVGGADLQLHPPYDQPFGDHLPGQRQVAHCDCIHLERMGAGRGQHCSGLFHGDHHFRHDCHRRLEPGNQPPFPWAGWSRSESRVMNQARVKKEITHVSFIEKYHQSISTTRRCERSDRRSTMFHWRSRKVNWSPCSGHPAAAKRPPCA